MSNKTKEKLKIFPFDSVSEMETRSRELAVSAFDVLETANHLKAYLKDTRFSHFTARYHQPWGISLEENGKSSPFVSAKIIEKTEAISATVNKDFLKDISNIELLEPLMGSVIKSLDESYRSIHGLGPGAKAAINSMLESARASDDHANDAKAK
ncbi:MAG: hypothetical protein EOP04_02245 [Proteobacteria bacterium]|nr:MAG: hypothetical protein EOP04_02245 [Pseudomonadota bacterium]